MTTLYARTVFFVADAERSRRFYTEQLGFSQDWDSGDGVFQVSLFGFELILNQAGDRTGPRGGRGRVFIGLEDDQGAPLRQHIVDRGIQTIRVEWGRPTLVIRDLDGNELFFWLPHDDLSGLGTQPAEVGGERTVHPAADVSISLETASAHATRDAVLEGLRSFNREHAVAPGFQPMTLAARTPPGEIVGGLVGETGWGWLHVDLLWVAAPYRRHGLGRSLLRMAEKEAAHRGCRHAYLDTFDFQALPFYEREGYEIFGVQEDYPPGHRRFFLRRMLGEAGRGEVGGRDRGS